VPENVFQQWRDGGYGTLGRMEDIIRELAQEIAQAQGMDVSVWTAVGVGSWR
jgi:hypothetical protein